MNASDVVHDVATTALELAREGAPMAARALLWQAWATARPSAGSDAELQQLTATSRGLELFAGSSGHEVLQDVYGSAQGWPASVLAVRNLVLAGQQDSADALARQLRHFADDQGNPQLLAYVSLAALVVGDVESAAAAIDEMLTSLTRLSKHGSRLGSDYERSAIWAEVLGALTMAGAPSKAVALAPTLLSESTLGYGFVAVARGLAVLDEELLDALAENADPHTVAKVIEALTHCANFSHFRKQLVLLARQLHGDSRSQALSALAIATPAFKRP